jgi:hypothetical protein
MDTGDVAVPDLQRKRRTTWLEPKVAVEVG